MAYFGTTQLSSLVNPPRLLIGRFAGVSGSTVISTANHIQSVEGGNHWFYKSTNTSTGIFTATFFTDGWELGIRAGDFMTSVSIATNNAAKICQSVITAASTSGCGSTGIFMSSTNS